MRTATSSPIHTYIPTPTRTHPSIHPHTYTARPNPLKHTSNFIHPHTYTQLNHTQRHSHTNRPHLPRRLSRVRPKHGVRAQNIHFRGQHIQEQLFGEHLKCRIVCLTSFRDEVSTVRISTSGGSTSSSSCLENTWSAAGALNSLCTIRLAKQLLLNTHDHAHTLTLSVLSRWRTLQVWGIRKHKDNNRNLVDAHLRAACQRLGNTWDTCRPGHELMQKGTRRSDFFFDYLWADFDYL
jgi:hypothetical protein